MTSPTEDASEIRVRVLPLDVELTVRPGESMMAAAQRHGYFWPTRCRGQALCTACLFEVVSGDEEFDPVQPLEQEALESLSEFQATRRYPLRLGCQARPGGPAAVFKRGMKPADRPRPTTGFWG
ncbi:2Fe-2S iron-sulfur cluster-binding protein [Streptomyces sp. NPDC057137]|uniref:2Fe-2S iron-sulfur cluster-binding protein n=1 Tax=Streptomyces sp. NPDC057137 TaxID=3346030 RepID=UPI003637F708